MTAMETEPRKKPSKKAAEALSTTEKMAAIVELSEAAPKPKPNLTPKPKAGTKGFDWQAEYPDEDVYVYTADGGLTIGLTRLGPQRKPKPGLLRRLHREGGMSVMWYFLELASSPTSLRLQEELEEEDYTKMLRGWAEFAGIELSE